MTDVVRQMANKKSSHVWREACPDEVFAKLCLPINTTLEDVLNTDKEFQANPKDAAYFSSSPETCLQC